MVTALVAGLAAAWLFDLSTEEGLLLGAILSATDGAAVFALMRGSHLPSRLARTLEAEAGFNDPVAVLLVVALVELIQTPGYGALDGGIYFVRELGIGAVIGAGVGVGAVTLLRRLEGAPSGLLLVSSAATAAVAYGAAASISGSGFLAVYLAGLVVGDAVVPSGDAIRAFHSGLASVAEIGMFLAFGLLVFPSQLGDVLVEGTLLGLIVACVARPLATLLATAFEPFTAAEKALIGWAGLRGAVPVILATFPVIDGVPRSLEFFNIVFFAVLVSTVLQGSTVELLAVRLGLTDRSPETCGRGPEIASRRVRLPDAIAPLREREFRLLFSGQTDLAHRRQPRPDRARVRDSRRGRLGDRRRRRLRLERRRPGGLHPRRRRLGRPPLPPPGHAGRGRAAGRLLRHPRVRRHFGGRPARPLHRDGRGPRSRRGVLQPGLDRPRAPDRERPAPAAGQRAARDRPLRAAPCSAPPSAAR